jgi:hypothetical protein
MSNRSNRQRNTAGSGTFSALKPSASTAATGPAYHAGDIVDIVDDLVALPAGDQPLTTLETALHAAALYGSNGDEQPLTLEMLAEMYGELNARIDNLVETHNINDRILEEQVLLTAPFVEQIAELQTQVKELCEALEEPELDDALAAQLVQLRAKGGNFTQAEVARLDDGTIRLDNLVLTVAQFERLLSKDSAPVAPARPPLA